MSTRILQISDLHLFVNKDIKFFGINPYDTLHSVLELVRAEISNNKTDLLVVTGDLSQDYSEESYDLLREMCKDIKAPVGSIPGNHDVFNVFMKKAIGANERYFVFKNWQILLLDTHFEGHISGFLSDEELSFLEDKLKSNPEKQTLIFLHHHVLPIESAWLNKIRLKNHQDFLSVIDKYKNVKVVVCGHIHQETYATRNDVDFISTPATCWQFLYGSPFFNLEDAMPGYRWFELYEDGSYKTGVLRVKHNSDFIPLHDSDGY